MLVAGVQTQGSAGYDEMTTEFEVHLKEVGATDWAMATSDKGNNRFVGNCDQRTVKDNIF